MFALIGAYSACHTIKAEALETPMVLGPTSLPHFTLFTIVPERATEGELADGELSMLRVFVDFFAKRIETGDCNCWQCLPASRPVKFDSAIQRHANDLYRYEWSPSTTSMHGS